MALRVRGVWIARVFFRESRRSCPVELVATPDSESGQLLQKDWEILTITGFGTFPSDNPSKCIDYIMQLKGTPECEVVGSQILRWFKSGDVTKASDHLPVMLDIKLPPKQ